MNCRDRGKCRNRGGHDGVDWSRNTLRILHLVQQAAGPRDDLSNTRQHLRHFDSPPSASPHSLSLKNQLIAYR